ncbi:uncharacterized protein LOC110610617 [Manihot esculenta]|uniref:Uncharacterized protein n=2 Tax=Manihot esculenta TaxID=3983 RepID=A0ACB7HVP6_MANES|nr:uncharacterized protein LOC110610617 [Manihot esculenta]KAG8656869.1 hypothetical protein MANES_03G014400v8 [Manihot esculenta]
MPRPGPRPYECVRRAWHSDRHQPIRGSLIQEIFRVVNEVHSSATKKNKEWQEKLPVVVLRAEEIIYSKANSEAEYMDLKTLWDRTNDAINTIIRRDESTETGELLQPCIEAALNLGCTPRRASRSQRNCNPRCYLSASSQEPNTFSPGIVNSSVQVNHKTSPQCIPNYLNFIKPTFVNSTHLGSDKFLLATDNGCLSNYNQCLPVENCAVSRLCSVYPLYFGSCIEPQQGSGLLSKSVPSTLEPAKMGGIEQSPLGCNEYADVKINQSDFKDISMQHQDVGCDLSLRLGSLSASLPSSQNWQLQDVEDVGSGEGSKFNNQMLQTDKEFTLFARVDKDNSLDSCPSKLSERVNINAKMKKRKAVYGHPVDDQACHWQPKLPCKDLTCRMRSADV